MDTTKQYIINRDTMALLPMDGPNGEWWTICVEADKMIVIEKKPLELIDGSCRYFGSSYEGGKQCVVKMMGYKSMHPISIAPALGICLFPLNASERRDTIWLSHSHIKNWRLKDKDSTILHFTNEQIMDLPIAKTSLEMRVYRTAQFRYRLRENMEAYRMSSEQVTVQKGIGRIKRIHQKDNGTFSIEM